jgi:mono/diheme cytochrome c family protein
MSPGIMLLLYCMLWSGQASQSPKSSEPGTTSSPVASKESTAATRERGKAIFVERCAKCHNEDANKTLPDGTTLLWRLARTKDPEARLGTRIKDLQERRQVYQYIVSLQTKSDLH